MRPIFRLALAIGAAAVAASAAAQTSVSVRINQPGVYGRINIGDVPRPALVRSQPIIVRPSRVVVERQPAYLYVPTAQQQNWHRYCGRYGACGQPVYFVRDEWVRERYGHEHPGWSHGRHRGWDQHDDRGRGHGKGHDGHRGRD